MAVQPEQSRLLLDAGFRHAFFTRAGGVSEGPYASLNFSWAVADRPDRVDENLRRGAGFLGVEPSRLFFLSQVHGRHVVAVRGDLPHEAVLHTEGDAVLVPPPAEGVAPLAGAVRTADCIPLLLADPTTGAVAAVHAGWRGVEAAIAGAAVEALVAAGASPGHLLAAIGPHISAAAFEVSDDVAEKLATASPVDGVVDRGHGPKPHVNLRAIVRAQLTAAGLDGAHVDDVEGCTLREPARFFSYRRDGKESGRHLSAIVPRRV